MRERRLPDWNAFRQFAERTELRNFAFRSQADASWTLTPLLLRRLERLGTSADEALSLEASALRRFKASAHRFIAPNEYRPDGSNAEWWAVMRHFGAPTRLLDWSLSIYVAAYFAASESPDSDGAIWLAHTSTAMEKATEEGLDGWNSSANGQNVWLSDAASPPTLVFYERLTQSERMLAQQGIFSICRNVLGNHGDLLDGVFSREEKTGGNFLKIVVPAELKVVFMRRLIGMNITASALFPGLDGLGRAVDERVRLGLK